MDFRQALALYESWGFSIIPIAYKGKKPLVKWEPYQQRKPDKEELVDWWGRYWSNGNEANIGIICGSVSGNLVVLDFDSEDSWAEFLRVWESLGLPNIYEATPVVRTGRGFQVYLRTKRPVTSHRLDSMDIKGEGDYVVAPPSMHPSGKVYEFINPGIAEIFLIDSFDDVGIKVSRKESSYEQGWVDKALESVTEGERDNTCIRLAGHYKAKGLRYEDTLTLLKDWALKCNPPFSEKEVAKCTKSAYGYLEKEAQNQAEALAHAKEVALKWLKLKDANIVDIALAVVAANKAPGDPVWLLIVGAPSTGKSEILRGLFDCEGVHPLGRLYRQYLCQWV